MDAEQPPAIIIRDGVIHVQEAEKTATRNHECKEGFFVIEFRYNPNFWSKPATYPEGVAHYNAKIKVFKVIDGKKVLVGKEFDGQYTDEGCFEDRSEDLVKRALKHGKTD